MTIYVQDAIDAFKKHGPMTASCLAALFNAERRDANRAIHGARRGKVKRIYIVRWTREPVEGLREYLRPVYSAGKRADALRPAPISSAESSRRYKQKRRDCQARERARVQALKGAVNSVFSFGEHLCSSTSL
jgi:hypothetical protein